MCSQYCASKCRLKKICKLKSYEMVERLKINILNFCMNKMAFQMISHILEIHSKMEFYKEKIGLFKRWQEPWSMRKILQNTYGQKL